MKRTREPVTIRGILVPADWDVDGNAVKAALFTAKEDEYLLEEDETTKELLGLMQQEVEVRGLLREEAGQKIITLESCRRA
jgi:hypothetical protein